MELTELRKATIIRNKCSRTFQGWRKWEFGVRMNIFHWLVSVVGQEVPLHNFRYHVCLNTLLAARLPFLFLICVL